MTFKTMVARLRKRLYVIAAIGLPAVAAAQSVPDVIGPIPANLPPGTGLTHNYPQLSSEPTDNLSSRGYVEEEFFFQGAATSYATPALADGVVVSTGHPYKSRMIVRRPADPSRFNGVVLVEWVNVTSGWYSPGAAVFPAGMRCKAWPTGCARRLLPRPLRIEVHDPRDCHPPAAPAAVRPRQSSPRPDAPETARVPTPC